MLQTNTTPQNANYTSQPELFKIIHPRMAHVKFSYSDLRENIYIPCIQDTPPPDSEYKAWASPITLDKRKWCKGSHFNGAWVASAPIFPQSTPQ